MKNTFARVAVTAFALGAALLAGAPAGHADEGVALRVTVSGATPSVSASAEPGSVPGLVAAVSGYVAGIRVDATECAVETSDPAGFTSGRASGRISGCAGSDVSFDVTAAGDGGAVGLRFRPGPGSCVLFCFWRFDVMAGEWVLDCPWGGSPF